jgi:predicted DNA-binding transcriptional regulator AlpA
MATSEDGGVSIELLSSQQVAKRLSMGVRTLWRLVAEGKFPQPIRYNKRLIRWKSDDVDRYIDGLA